MEINGKHTSVNIAPTLGHTFRLARRRISIATLGYVGMSIRNQHTEVVDDEHDFTQQLDTTKVYADLGVLISFGVRMGKHMGLNLDGVIPLYVGPPSNGFPFQWTIASPYGALSLSYYF
ncbi:MAG: hypothetical protein V3V08_02760 [Nannocystaceae bacterium]